MAGTSSHFDFDAVIVGSGFGGSVMAYRLSDAGLRVCVLERGQAYAPGKFPRSPRAVADNVWDRSRGHKGLFDFWSFDSMEAVVASGLGGGSLIYANVMLRMPDEYFVVEDDRGGTRPWPVAPHVLRPHYAAVETMLGATEYPYAASTPKTKAFLRSTAAIGLDTVRPLNLAISFAVPGGQPSPGVSLGTNNLHNAPRSTCVGCGECDAGCNYGAKNTTDLTYLSKAKAAGAEIRTRSEALWIKPVDGGYEVQYLVHREDLDNKPLTEDELPKCTVTSRALVLSAGSLATTHLLLRNRGNLPRLSRHLGTRFSGNGDALAFVVDAGEVLDPSDGPVITAAAHSRDDLEPGGEGRGFYLQDGGYPQFFNWVRQTVPPFGTAGRFGRFAAGQVWAHLRRNPHSEISGELRRVLGRQRTAYSLVLLGIGRSRADGVMTLRNDWLAIDWSMRSSATYYQRVRDAMEACAFHVGGKFRDNALSRVGRVVAAHPLGGCPMGSGPGEGVVDDHGRVYGYEHLVIADGSVLPSAAGANPSLTIAALADLFADGLIASLSPPRSAPPPPTTPPPTSTPTSR